MSKSIQIPEELFCRLSAYHLLDRKEQEQELAIQQGLQKKLNAIQRRSDYKDFLLTTKKQER